MESQDDPVGILHHIELRFVLGRAVEAILSSILAVVFGGYERSNVERYFFCITALQTVPSLSNLRLQQIICDRIVT